MTRRQQNRRSRLENLRSPHRARLYLEPLEARRLLAGLQVSVFVDSDGSRSFEPGVESAAANRLVYVDLNANGRFESAEPIAVTNSQGIAHFDDLADGDYLVGLLTNPATQKTTTSTNVNPIANGLTTGAATVVLADDELEHVWAVDEQGFASRVDDPNDSVDFGGRVLDSLATAENLLVVVKASPSIPSGLASFDLASGAISPIELGSPDFAGTIRELELHNGSITATAEDGDTITVLAVALDGLVAEQTVIVSGQFLAVAANPVEDLVIVAEATEQGSLIYAAGDAVNARGTFEFDSAVASLHFNASGDQLFVTLEEGGVRVLSIGRIGMELEAILSDAAGPMAESLADGRLITASSQADNKLLVWDSNTWQPLGTTELPVNSQLGNLRVDSFGDELLIATTLGIYSAELAVPVGLPIEVAGDATSAAILGVRPLGSNNAPQTDSGVRRSVDEDNVDTFGSDELPVTDADGDTLWFRLQAAPSRGSLVSLPEGAWKYTPNRDFAGIDSATITVFDGIDTADLTLHWDVHPVNDPPIALHIQLPDLPENSEPGTAIGFISVEDPDLNPNYRVTTTDARFRVESGQVFFVDGDLDYETEPEITFEVIATDQDNTDFAITMETTLQLSDINESPSGFELHGGTVDENVPGATIGDLRVIDPDADSQYDVELSDPRFTLLDGALKLVDGESLDHEQEPQVTIGVFASERDGSDSVSGTVTITVNDKNDAPTSLQLLNTMVAADSAGIAIGQVVVQDQDNDEYEFSVDDGRLEIINNVLKVKDDSTIPESEQTLTVFISATSESGDRIAEAFELAVTPPPSPHHNPNEPMDANGDGKVSPLDALIIIDALNNHPGGRLPPVHEGGEPPQERVDVNNDGYISAIDALSIINYLNQERSAGEGEGLADGYGEQQYAAYGPQLPGSQLPFEDLERKEARLAIDLELERLLEELARARQSNS